MTDVGMDTYRLSYAEKTGAHYSGAQNEIANIGSLDVCRDECISTVGCKSWYYNSSGQCFISAENPNFLIETPSFPNDTAGKVADSYLPNTGLIAFWALLAFLLLLVLLWSTTSHNGVMALTGKIAYYHNGKFNTFQRLDAKIL